VAQGLIPEGTDVSAAAAVVTIGGDTTGRAIGVGGPDLKPCREIYVGNLPPGVTSIALTTFMNDAFKQLGELSPLGAVVNVWVPTDGKFAFVEVATVEHCNAGLRFLTGLQLGGYQLRLGRPKGFNPSVSVSDSVGNFAPVAGSATADVSGSGTANPVTLLPCPPPPPNFPPPPLHGPSGPGLAGRPSPPSLPSVPLSHSIMMTNLPVAITEEQVRELVSPFGALSGFNLINDPGGETRTAAFEYEAATDAITTGAVEGLDGLQLGTFKLLVRRIPAATAAILLQKSEPPSAPMTASSTVTGTAASQDLVNLAATSVLRLSNMVTLQDLMDDASYAELVEDVGDELNQYGTVKQIVVPKCYPDGSVPGIGNTSSGKFHPIFMRCMLRVLRPSPVALAWALSLCQCVPPHCPSLSLLSMK